MWDWILNNQADCMHDAEPILKRTFSIKWSGLWLQLRFAFRSTPFALHTLSFNALSSYMFEMVKYK